MVDLQGSSSIRRAQFTRPQSDSFSGHISSHSKKYLWCELKGLCDVQLCWSICEPSPTSGRVTLGEGTYDKWTHSPESFKSFDHFFYSTPGALQMLRTLLGIKGEVGRLCPSGWCNIKIPMNLPWSDRNGLEAKLAILPTSCNMLKDVV